MYLFIGESINDGVSHRMCCVARLSMAVEQYLAQTAVAPSLVAQILQALSRTLKSDLDTIIQVSCGHIRGKGYSMIDPACRAFEHASCFHPSIHVEFHPSPHGFGVVFVASQDVIHYMKNAISRMIDNGNDTGMLRR